MTVASAYNLPCQQQWPIKYLSFLLQCLSRLMRKYGIFNQGIQVTNELKDTIIIWQYWHTLLTTTKNEI